MWSKKLYDNIVAKVSAIDISGFVLIIQNNTDKLGIEKKIDDADKKIPDTNELVKKTDFNAKTSKIQYEIPSITGLAATSALHSVESKITELVSVLVKQTDYDTKISDTDIKYFTIFDHNKFTGEILDTNIKKD